MKGCLLCADVTCNYKACSCSRDAHNEKHAYHYVRLACQECCTRSEHDPVDLHYQHLQERDSTSNYRPDTPLTRTQDRIAVPGQVLRLGTSGIRVPVQQLRGRPGLGRQLALPQDRRAALPGRARPAACSPARFAAPHGAKVLLAGLRQAWQTALPDMRPKLLLSDRGRCSLQHEAAATIGMRPSQTMEDAQRQGLRTQ